MQDKIWGYLRRYLNMTTEANNANELVEDTKFYHVCEQHCLHAGTAIDSWWCCKCHKYFPMVETLAQRMKYNVCLNEQRKYDNTIL